MDKQSRHIFRIDRFVVPEAARSEFIAVVESAHVVIGEQAGCVQNRVLATEAEGGSFKVVTLVEWDSPESFSRAKAALAAHHRRAGFDGPGFLARIGAQVERGEFSPVP